MERRLLVATGNPGKVVELAELLRGAPFTLVSLRDLGLPTEIEEPADTFEGNAVIKAETYARMSGLLTLADDSGLEVDALDGAPGVHSRRFAGDDASDDDRTALVLARLDGVPWERRTARYRCVLALAAPNEPTVTCEGACSGIIEYGPRGDGGFGYDPVFYLPDYGRTVAELSLEEKNRVSHRARAAREAAAVLMARAAREP